MFSPQIHIKLFEPQFLEKLEYVLKNTIETCYPAIYHQKVVDFFIDYHNHESILKRSENGLLFCLFRNNALVGTGFLVNAEIGGVYVLPEHQNAGLGKILVLYLLDTARQIGLNKVWLDATPNSLPLYKKLGFKLVEERVMYVEGQPLPYYYMEYYL